MGGFHSAEVLTTGRVVVKVRRRFGSGVDLIKVVLYGGRVLGFKQRQPWCLSLIVFCYGKWWWWLRKRREKLADA